MSWLRRLTYFLVIGVIATGALPAFAQNTARKALFEWEAISGAKNYEIVIEKDAKLVAKHDTKLNSFEAQLVPGLYTFKVRARDANDRPGEFSQASPLFVAPDPGTITNPKNGAELKTYSILERLEVKTQSGAQAECRQLELFSTDTSKTVGQIESCAANDLLRFDALVPGNYELRLRIGTKNPLSDKTIFSEAVVKSKFSVKKLDLQKPVPLRPKDSFVKAPTPAFIWRWSSVPDAEEYHLQIYRTEDGSNGTGETRKAAAPLEFWIAAAKTPTLAVKWPEAWGDGSYRYEITAAREKRTVVSEIAEQEFFIDRLGSFSPGHAESWLGLSTFPRYYRVSSITPTGKLVQNSSGIGLASETRYWLGKSFGLMLAVRTENIDLDSKRYFLTSVAPGLAWRLRLSTQPASPTIAFSWQALIEENLVANPSFGPSFAQPIVANTTKAQILKTRVGADLTLMASEHVRFAWHSDISVGAGQIGKSSLEVKPGAAWDTHQAFRVLLTPWRAFTVAPEVGGAFSKIKTREKSEHGLWDATKYFEFNLGVRVGLQL